MEQARTRQTEDIILTFDKLLVFLAGLFIYLEYPLKTSVTVVDNITCIIAIISLLYLLLQNVSTFEIEDIGFQYLLGITAMSSLIYGWETMRLLDTFQPDNILTSFIVFSYVMGNFHGFVLEFILAFVDVSYFGLVLTISLTNCSTTLDDLPWSQVIHYETVIASLLLCSADDLGISDHKKRVFDYVFLIVLCVPGTLLVNSVHEIMCAGT